MWNSYRTWRCIRQVITASSSSSYISGNDIVAVRRSSFNAVSTTTATTTNNNNGSSGSSSKGAAGRAVNLDTADTTMRSEKGQLLKRLVWRARDVLFMDEANKKKKKNDGRNKLKDEHNKLRTSQQFLQPRISHIDATGLFDVEWCEAVEPTQNTQGGNSIAPSSTLTREGKLTLVCELLAVALKLRRAGASPEFLPVQMTMVVPPLRAAEAVYAPLGRQVRLWSEQREWHMLIACVAATFGPMCDECVSEDELKDVVRQFLDKLDIFCLPSTIERTRGHRQSQKEKNKGVLHPSRDTLPNTLWRITMLYRVMEGLLWLQRETVGLSLSNFGGRDEELKEREKRSRLKSFVRCVLQEIERRVFTFHDPSGVMEKVEGLEALVSKAFQRCCSLEHDNTRSRTYKGELPDALLSFCGAYFKIMTFCLSEGAVETSAMNAVKGDNCSAVIILRIIRQCWLRQQSFIHLHGVQPAFWWLRLVPIVIEGLFDVTTKMSKKCSSRNSYNVHLETLQMELRNMICSMLYFDETIFEERRAALLAQHITADDATGGSSNCDNGNSDNTSDGTGVVDDTQLRRPRGGRSLFKKTDEKEGVLIPSSKDALRKTSRFSSRRGWEVSDVSMKTASCKANSCPAVNSPLFDIIAASKDAVLQLSDFFSVDKSPRSSALEMMWLALLTAHHRVQEARLTLKLLQSPEKRQQQHLDVKSVEKSYGTTREEEASEMILPPFVSSSLWHLATALAAAVYRVYEMADTMYLRDENIRRTVGVAIVAGTQGTLLENYFYTDALASNWWLRSGAPFLFHYHYHMCLPRFSTMLEGSLMNLLSQRSRRHPTPDWLKQSTTIAFNCLAASSPTGGAVLPLLPSTKQWTAVLILSNLRDVVYIIKNANNSGGLRASLTVEEEKEVKALQQWAREAFSSLLSTLIADGELLLLCGYASFIDALFELHIRLETGEDEVARFWDKALLKVLLPAVLISLTNSAEEDNAETHAAACESALFVIAELSRFAFWSDVKMLSGDHSDDNNILISVAVYCLRQARRGGGKRASGYGLPAAQLPPVKYTQVMNISATISFLLKKNSKCSYLHVLDLSNSLLPFSKVQPLYGDRESSCISALQHYLQNVHRVSSFSSGQKQLLEESVKCLSFMASTSISAHVLGYLVRFIEHHLRVQERLSRTSYDNSFSVRTYGDRRENAISFLTRVEAAPLVLLDYIGYLTCAGSWTMVTWAFNLAETSLRVRRKHQLATTTSLDEVATTAILSQLRALSIPSTQKLPHNMLKSILCLSDMMSGSPMTLLGFERNSPLSGLMKSTTRGEYRTMLFALKQAVILVHRASVNYRVPPLPSTEENAFSENSAERILEVEGERKGETYFTSSVATQSVEAHRQLRVFIDCLVACFDSVLDVMRGCALQQDVLDDELRDLLLLVLQTLLRVLQGCLQAVLQVPPFAWEGFHAERAHMLWAGLCIAALLGRVVAVDYGRVCFTGNIRRSTDSVLSTVGELLDACINGASDNADGDSVVSKGKQAGGKNKRSETHFVDILTTSVKTILSDPQVSHRLAIRLGFGTRQRSDLTALLLALRAFAVASARYRPAGCIIHRAWRALCVEVAQVKRPSIRKGKRATNTTPNATLCVPSKDELQLLLDSFRELEKELTESAVSRKEQRRQADFVVDWTCELTSQILDSVIEDPTLLQNEDGCDLVLEKNNNVDELPLDLVSSGVESPTAPTAGPLVGMDAAMLLQEEEEEEEGKRVENIDLLEALVRQCRRVHMTSVGLVIDDAALAIPQTKKVIITHYNCVTTAFNRCTLTEIVTLPCAEFIFATLEIFARRRSPVPRENCRTLWSQLTERWKDEFLEPYSDRFEHEQRTFLQLVQQRRSLMRLTEKDGIGGELVGAAANPPALSFLLKENVMAQLAKYDMLPVPDDVDLLSHDDLSKLETEQKRINWRKVKSHANNALQQEREPPHVPLDILFTLLVDIPRGPCNEVELGNFARVVVTYIARRYILLRERSDKNVMNVMQTLELTRQHNPRVYDRRRLPLTCAHAADVAEWFLTSSDRQAIMKAFAADAGGREVTVSSAEHGVFEYMRSACLYLHLLALSVHVCHRLRLFCDSDYGDNMQQQQQQQQGRYGFEEDGGETTEWGALNGQKTNARLAERRLRADNRQTDVDSVNMNLLENILLHFLNVSLALVEHADLMAHRATSIAVAPDSDYEKARKALLYADELRLMVAVTLQDTLRVLLRDAPLEFSLARRVTHRILCNFSCELIPTTLLTGTHTGNQRKLPELSPVNMVALKALSSKRPELFVRSPTLLCILSPSFFNEVLSQHIRSALSLSVTQVVASLHFYLRRPDAHLAPLMLATTSILSSTFVRNAALRLFCENLCGQIVDRPSFRDALAPPTVASAQQGAAGSVSNEVLIPFLASICREDAFVSKNALATVLYHSMNLRPDVFGQPPTADRFSRFAITRRGGSSTNKNNSSMSGFAEGAREGSVKGSHGNMSAVVRDGTVRSRLSLGVQHTDVLLESPMSVNTGGGDTTAVLNAENEEQDELEALGRFKADQSDETATRTHKRALASLNLTLAEVMETAMHFAAMRSISAEEKKKAKAMIRSADDARHERIATFRSAVPMTISHNDTVAPSFPGGGSTAGYPDAALRIEEPMHFGVVMLHIRFALRKIIHISMRRLAAQQGARTLSMMVEMLREVDPKWHRIHNNNNNELRRQSDSMLAGTLRVLVARSVMCVDLAGEAGDLVGGGAGGIAMSAVGMQRTKRALYMVQRARRHNMSNDRSGNEDDGEKENEGKHRRSIAVGLLSTTKRFVTRSL